MGNGLFLATAHSVKGLEFDHVFILGDSWHESSRSTIEDERRLYYVSMSRAREMLHLFSLDSSANPHIALLNGDFLMRRKPSVPIGGNGPARSYHLLGMDDFFIDFAGTKPEQHPARLALPDIKAGDVVNIEQRKNHVELTDKEGVSFARLSRKAQSGWSGRLSTIKEVRIVAMVSRNKEDLLNKELQATCFGDYWEVPIVEVVC
jgi:ATP-dependent DNA helicase RecQ